MPLTIDQLAKEVKTKFDEVSEGMPLEQKRQLANALQDYFAGPPAPTPLIETRTGKDGNYA